MPIRLRKLLGSIVLVVYSIFYFWVAVTVAIVRLPGLATGWHLLFYFLTTVVWMIPAAAIIYWIQVPRAGDPAPPGLNR
jgi:hypothetical protein